MANYRIAFPAYRVFIYGLEVTQDVVAVTINSHDSASPNQCQITLNSKFDRYIVNTHDLIAIRGLDRLKVKTRWSGAIRRPYTEMDPIKGKILARKKIITQDLPIEYMDDPFGKPMNKNDLSAKYFDTTISDYPINDGSPIFHAMDPVRVFFRDPYNPSMWYHKFCGFVSDMTETSNENNVKTLTIIAEDPTKLFRYTRVALNPGILDSKKAVQNQDLKVQSFWTNFLVDFSLPEVFYSIIFGPGAINIRDPNSKKAAYRNKVTDLRGIGHFSKLSSQLATFGPETSDKNISKSATDDYYSIQSTLGKNVFDISSLSSWQLLLSHQVTLFDLYTMASDEDKIMSDGSINPVMNERLVKVNRSSGSNDDINIKDVISYIGSRPDEYPVDGGRLMMLMPRSLGVANSNVMMKGLINSYPLKSDFTTVGQILFDVISRIEFSMYCSPRGDIIVEPPLCDFDPYDFSVETTNPDSTGMTSDYTDSNGHQFRAGNQAIELFESKLNRLDKNVSNNYIVPLEDTVSVTSTISDEKVYTIATTKRALFQNWDNLPYSDIVGDIHVVKRPSLIPLYGIRAVPVTDRGYINTAEAAQLYAEITLNRMNADAHVFKVQQMPNIKAWINRPTYIESKNVVATVRTINDSITWGKNGDMSTSLDLNYARTWNGDVDANGNMIYTTIGGYASKPFNYAVLFGTAQKPEPSAAEDKAKSVDVSQTVDDFTKLRAKFLDKTPEIKWP